MTITKQRLNEILKEEISRELQEQKLLQEKMRISKEVYEKILSAIVDEAMSSGGSRKLFNFKRFADRIIEPWAASISGKDTDFYAVAKNLTKGERGRKVAFNLMALIYAGMKDIKKETGIYMDLDPEVMQKDKNIFYKSALKVGREPEKFLSGLGRLGTKIGIGKSKLSEIKSFCTYVGRIFLLVDPDTFVDDLTDYVKQNYREKERADKAKRREAERLAAGVLHRLRKDSEVDARRMIDAVKAYDDKTISDLLDRPLRKTGIFDKYYREDEEFYNLIKSYASDGTLIAKILGTDADKEGYLQ